MDTKVEKAKNNTYKIDVTIDKAKVAEEMENSLRHEAEHIEIKGFRKGKAPLNVVRENIDKGKLRNHALNHLLSDAYSRVIKENKLQPIVYPRFNIKQFEENKDLTLTITVIEKPEIKIKDYQSVLKKLGKDRKSETPVTNQEVIKVILGNSDVGIADELVDEEVQRMMSSLIDQTGKMGLTVDQYLQSVNKTVDQLREEYKKSANDNIKVDFVLTEIAEKEGIKVEDSEIDVAIDAVPDNASKEALKKPEQKMYIKAVLLKNKILQKITEYAKEEKNEQSK